jgi:hypothetical protein
MMLLMRMALPPFVRLHGRDRKCKGWLGFLVNARPCRRLVENSRGKPVSLQAAYRHIKFGALTVEGLQGYPKGVGANVGEGLRGHSTYEYR